MEINFTPKADEDLYYWKNTNNVQVLKKLERYWKIFKLMRFMD